MGGRTRGGHRISTRKNGKIGERPNIKSGKRVDSESISRGLLRVLANTRACRRGGQRTKNETQRGTPKLIGGKTK